MRRALLVPVRAGLASCTSQGGPSRIEGQRLSGNHSPDLISVPSLLPTCLSILSNRTIVKGTINDSTLKANTRTSISQEVASKMEESLFSSRCIYSPGNANVICLKWEDEAACLLVRQEQPPEGGKPSKLWVPSQNPDASFAL